MTATSQPTLDTLPDMRNVAAIIAQDARENQAGVDVISVGPVYGEQADHGLQYSVNQSRRSTRCRTCAIAFPVSVSGLY
jgi:hypothetical protein